MKKILCTLLGILSVTVLFAQQPTSPLPIDSLKEEPKPVFYIGPKLGVNIMPNYKTEALGQFYQMGINAGIAMRIALNDHFYISPELLYSKKKKTYSFDSQQSLLSIFNNGLTGGLIDTAILSAVAGVINDTVYSHTEGAVSLSYFEFPLLLTYHTGPFEFSAGPYFANLLSISGREELTQRSALLDLVLPFVDTIQFVGPLISALVNSQFPGYAEPDISNYSDKGPFRNFDYGFVADICYHLSPDFKMNLRYLLGSLNYRHEPLSKHDVNRSFQVSLTYLVGIKRRSNDEATSPMYDDYVPAPGTKKK